MNILKIISIIFFISFSFNLSYSNENEVETFYYTQIVETIGGYIDEHNSTLGYLYDLSKILDTKLENTNNENNKKTLEKLIEINNSNIERQVKNLDISKNNIDTFIKYFEGKGDFYKDSLEKIKQTGILNAKNKSGESFFDIVLNYGDYNDIDFVLNKGINPNNINTSLESSFLNFISKGGKFYPKDYDDKTLAGKQNLNLTRDIIENVINKGFDINLIEKIDQNIIFQILDLKDLYILDLLLKKENLDLNIYNKNGLTPVYYTIKQNYSDDVMIKLIKNEKFDINTFDNEENNLLQAISTKDIKIFDIVFEKNIELNHTNNIGQNEIIKIIYDNENENEIIEKYNKIKEYYKELDLDIKDNSGNNALFVSIEKKYKNLFEKLLEDDIDYKTLNNDDIAILSFGVKNNIDNEFVSKILELDIDINNIDSLGNNALHYALINNNYEQIKLLLEAGVDPNKLNNENKNLLTYVIDNRDYKLLEIGLSYKLDINQKLEEKDGENIFLYAVKKYDLDLLKNLIINSSELGLNINFIDESKQNGLFYSIIARDYSITKLLIEYGINTNIKNDNGQTPLMIAADTPNLNIMKLLVNNSNNLNTLDLEGKNAYLYACIIKNKNNMRVLKQAGINTKVIDYNGNSCETYINNN